MTFNPATHVKRKEGEALAQLSIVVGIDGGGTYTRALAADLTGRVLAQAQAGGANPAKNADAEQNVQRAIQQVLADAGCPAAQVVGVVAGLAGLDAPEDRVWAEQFTSIPGLPIKPHCVNDAVIAWAGALRLQPGIIVIAGTGCILFAVTESGRQVRNYDFWHYAEATARNLAFDAVFRILAGEYGAADQPLVDQILTYFGVHDLPALALLASENEQRDSRTIIRLYSECAPLITAAAERGIPLACAVCDTAVTALARGVRLLGSLFTSDTVTYALIGSVARSAYVQQQLIQQLAQPANRRYQPTEPTLAPEAGAALLALQRYGVTVTGAIIEGLGQHKQ
jgi:glucosamine kinase